MEESAGARSDAAVIINANLCNIIVQLVGFASRGKNVNRKLGENSLRKRGGKNKIYKFPCFASAAEVA